MNLTIISLGAFGKDVKRLYKKYKNIADDLNALKQVLQDNPKAGTELGNGCYKIRLANSSVPTGKSGGFRVIYYYLDIHNNLYLMAMYSKTELEAISDDVLLKLLRDNGLN